MVKSQEQLSFVDPVVPPVILTSTLPIPFRLKSLCMQDQMNGVFFFGVFFFSLPLYPTSHIFLLPPFHQHGLKIPYFLTGILAKRLLSPTHHTLTAGSGRHRATLHASY